MVLVALGWEHAQAPLIMAYLLVAEAVIHVVSVPGPKIMLFQAKIPMGDQDAYTYSGIARIQCFSLKHS